MNLMYEMIFVVVSLFVFLPIFVGLGISLLLGLTGLSFWFMIMGVTLLIWGIIGILFYS